MFTKFHYSKFISRQLSLFHFDELTLLNSDLFPVNLMVNSPGWNKNGRTFLTAVPRSSLG